MAESGDDPGKQAGTVLRILATKTQHAAALLLILGFELRTQLVEIHLKAVARLVVGQGAADVGKGAVDATKSAVDVTKSAVDAVVKLPTARMTTGRERCAVAPNGAPDCLSAAEMLCRKQGFSTGKSLDFTSAEECPPSTLLGQKSRDECYTVTFISRAMCQ